MIDQRLEELRKASTLASLDVLEHLSAIGRKSIKKNPKFAREILGALIALAKVYGLLDPKERSRERPEDLPPTIEFHFPGATREQLHGSLVARELAKITGQELPALDVRPKEVTILPPAKGREAATKETKGTKTT
jgi:hypothetical protein